jgi:hypothetical protein
VTDTHSKTGVTRSVTRTWGGQGNPSNSRVIDCEHYDTRAGTQRAVRNHIHALSR